MNTQHGHYLLAGNKCRKCCKELNLLKQQPFHFHKESRRRTPFQQGFGSTTLHVVHWHRTWCPLAFVGTHDEHRHPCLGPLGLHNSMYFLCSSSFSRTCSFQSVYLDILHMRSSALPAFGCIHMAHMIMDSSNPLANGRQMNILAVSDRLSLFATHTTMARYM